MNPSSQEFLMVASAGLTLCGIVFAFAFFGSRHKTPAEHTPELVSPTRLS